MRPAEHLGGRLDPDTYADLVELAADAIVVCDEGGRVLWANAQVEQLLGWAREDLVGRPVEVLVPPALKSAHLQHRDAFDHNPQSRSMGADLTLTAVRADGNAVPVDISLTPIETESGRLVAAAIRDASVRRDVEQALALSREQLRTSLDSMLDGFAVFSSVRGASGAIEDFVFAYVNEVGATTYGRSAADLVGMSLSAAVPGFRVSPFFPAYVRVVETGQSWSPDPTEYTDAVVEGVFELRAWKHNDGFAVTWRDVSPLFRTVAQHRRSEELLRAVVGHLPDALSLFDVVRDEDDRAVDFRFQLANRSASLLTRFTAEELVGKSILEALPALASPGLLDLYRAVVETGEPLVEPQLELEGPWHDGATGPRFFDVRVSRLADGLLVITRDVTHDRSREGELRQRQAELERSNMEMRQLNELADLLQGCQSPDEAYSVAASLCARLFPGMGGGLSAVSPSRDVVEVKVTWGRGPDGGREAFSPTDCWALRRGQPHVSGPWTPRCPHLGPPREEAGRVLCVPMAAQGQTAGAFHLVLPTQEEGTATLTQLALTVSAQLSLAISNLELRETLRGLSIRDPLTGLFNRRYMEETLTRELARAERQGSPLAVLQLDVDHFKRVNDEHGHDAGDAVLRVVAQVLRVLVRDGDVVCRFGGEEFTAILPGIDHEVALQRMRDVQARLLSSRIPFHGYVLDAPTISGGLAMYPVDALSGEDLLHAADQALYAAKAAGRDRVVAVSGAHARREIVLHSPEESANMTSGTRLP